MTDELFTPEAMPEPIDLSPELQRESERRDLAIQKALDGKWGIYQEKVGAVLFELNRRLVEYRAQFNTYADTFRVVQSVQDFNRIVVPLQVDWQKFNIKKPVAVDRASHKLIMFGESQLFEYKKEQE